MLSKPGPVESHRNLELQMEGAEIDGRHQAIYSTVSNPIRAPTNRPVSAGLAIFATFPLKTTEPFPAWLVGN